MPWLHMCTHPLTNILLRHLSIMLQHSVFLGHLLCFFTSSHRLVSIRGSGLSKNLWKINLLLIWVIVMLKGEVPFIFSFPAEA